MATNYAASYIASLEDATRYGYRQAQAEGAARIKHLTPSERILRLSSRYATAKREGRMQAAAAIKRMAIRIVEEVAI